MRPHHYTRWNVCLRQINELFPCYFHHKNLLIDTPSNLSICNSMSYMLRMRWQGKELSDLSADSQVFFAGMDIRKRCSWCQYMTCLPTHLWACSGNRDITCRNFTEGKEFLREDCFDQRMREWSTIPSWNQTNREFIKQCIRTCV